MYINLYVTLRSVKIYRYYKLYFCILVLMSENHTRDFVVYPHTLRLHEGCLLFQQELFVLLQSFPSKSYASKQPFPILFRTFNIRSNVELNSDIPQHCQTMVHNIISVFKLSSQFRLKTKFFNLHLSTSQQPCLCVYVTQVRQLSLLPNGKKMAQMQVTDLHQSCKSLCWQVNSFNSFLYTSPLTLRSTQIFKG